MCWACVVPGQVCIAGCAWCWGGLWVVGVGVAWCGMLCVVGLFGVVLWVGWCGVRGCGGVEWGVVCGVWCGVVWGVVGENTVLCSTV